MKDKPASQQIDDIIAQYGEWKGKLLSEIRAAVLEADTNIVEEVKWKMATRPEGLPVWSLNGIICFAETWNDNIKLLFPKGAQLKDPKNLFNARLKSKDIRAIEFKENDSVDKVTLQQFVYQAVKLNAQK